MNWIVRDEPKQEAPESFEDRIASALQETGINPADWTDEQLAAWREEENWEVGQAMRIEASRRKAERDPEATMQYSGAWVR